MSSAALFLSVMRSFTDQANEQQYIPLNDLGFSQARFTICNSSLSEYGTLGFELGYSLVSPDSANHLGGAILVDFANTRNVSSDQFIAAGERKWLTAQPAW